MIWASGSSQEADTDARTAGSTLSEIEALISTKRIVGLLAGLGLLALLVWIVWSAWLTGPVISDSWQSVGPSVFSRYPFDLTGAFLGDFDGYDKTWGHHWPGWALFMSLFVPWLGFGPIMAFSIEAILVALAALMVFRIGAPEAKWYYSVSFMGLALLNPEINVSLSMMRPEPLTGLMMIVLAWAVVDSLGRGLEMALILFCAAALPLLHVLGVIAPPAMIGIILIWHRFSARGVWADHRRPKLLALAGGWMIGASSLAAWFLVNPDRLHQFKENLAAQRLSAHSLWNSFRLCYLGDVGGGMTLLLWLALAFAMVASIQRTSRNLRCLLWAAMPLAAVVFSILAHNPNRLHLAAVIPCALMACKLGGLIPLNRIGKWSGGVLLPVMAFALAFHLNRGFKIWQIEGKCPRPILVELLRRHQGHGKLYIPLSLWEAAATLPAPEALFYTFPNVAVPEYREAAERSLFANALPGDRLIFDVTQNQANNDYFKREAFVHLTHVDAGSLGPVIETCVVEGMSGSRRYHVIQILHPPFPQ